MGLAVRVIPTLLAGTRLVKGKRFEPNRIVGHVQQAAEVHQARGVDELIILDVEASARGRGPNFDLVRRITEVCFMPLTVGGGVRNVEDFQRLLDAGADKVSVKTAYWAQPEFLMHAAAKFGCQAIVAAMDWQVELSVPLHSANNAVRNSLMPVNKKYPLPAGEHLGMFPSIEDANAAGDYYHRVQELRGKVQGKK